MAAPTTLFRLTDILTKEVSLVDRAANKRTFLLVKRDDMPTEIKPNAAGGFDTVTPPAAAPAASPTAPAVAKLTVSKSLLSALTSTIEKLTALASGAEAAETNSEGVAKALTEALAELAVPAPAEVVKSAPRPTECLVAKGDRVEVIKFVSGALGKLNEIAASLAITPAADATPDDIRWKIQDVLRALCEFAGYEIAVAAIGVPTPVTKAAVSPAPQFAALARSLSEVLSSVPGSNQDTIAPVTDAQNIAVLEKADTVIKALRTEGDTLRKRVAELEARVSAPSAVPIEQGEVKKSTGVSWPADMNSEPDAA
jgi:hypothetical protein